MGMVGRREIPPSSLLDTPGPTFKIPKEARLKRTLVKQSSKGKRPREQNKNAPSGIFSSNLEDIDH